MTEKYLNKLSLSSESPESTEPIISMESISEDKVNANGLANPPEVNNNSDNNETKDKLSETEKEETSPESDETKGDVLQSQQSDSQNPDSANDPVPASAVDGGRETSDTILYVGGLSKTIPDETIKELFARYGTINSIKILNDKNKPGFNYAFVEFELNKDSNMALQELNGSIVGDDEIKINWAYQSAAVNTSAEPSFNLFVGDLSPDVDDETLSKAFCKFTSLKQAHVMWDMQTSRSRGYGFVSFRDQVDAELALQTMNGTEINGRAIRCNWASYRHQMNPRPHRNQHNTRHYRGNYSANLYPHALPHNPKTMQVLGSQYPHSGNPGLVNHAQSNGFQMQQHANLSANTQQTLNVMSAQSYDIILRQTPSWQTTVYLGNIAHFTQQTDLIPLLQNFGFIVDFKFHPEKGCAFVKYDSHERAALAIVQLAGFAINGRPLKCGWGKDRTPIGQYPNFSRAIPHASMYSPNGP